MGREDEYDGEKWNKQGPGSKAKHEELHHLEQEAQDDGVFDAHVLQ